MSEMNGVSNLLATWVKFSWSRKHIYNHTKRPGKSCFRVVGAFLKYAFVYLLKWAFYRHWAKVFLEPTTWLKHNCLSRNIHGKGWGLGFEPPLYLNNTFRTLLFNVGVEDRQQHLQHLESCKKENLTAESGLNHNLQSNKMPMVCKQAPGPQTCTFWCPHTGHGVPFSFLPHF